MAMLRIDASSPAAGDTTITLAGSIGSEHLPELEHLLSEARAAGRRLSFDLRKIGLVDRAAVEFFVSGPGRDARLTGCPEYLRQWLAASGRAAD